MNRIASFALLVMGIVLLALGWDAYRSVSSDVARVFTGAPTDRALWLLIGGGLAAVSGLGGLARRK
ncbi:MAG: hypothetical protein COV48_01715 [Elusimicrobia bacterium CG11_big_fil_rev_8_21_14_0_20_64_6]|nr:MAG: hypothetical protein COV48_01715 [Elusimicrobia bacterium CG11_big_fil_rev_8_21_14_0_20_64_6]